MWPFSLRTTRPAKSSRRTAPSVRPRLESLEDRCLMSAGALDTTFGGTGVVNTSLSKSGDNAWTSLLQPNGDIITAGTTVSGPHKTPSFALVAYTPSGSLDTSFGSGGKVITPASALSAGQHVAATEYPSTDASGNANKIVEVGNANGTGITLVRYNPNGTLDTTFGNKGMVTTNLSTIIATSVAIQPDGKIVVGGWYGEGGNNSAFLLLRYNIDGSLDRTFGNNGEVITYPVTGGDSINSVLVQPDGKIVVGGYAAYDNYVYPDGSTQTFAEFTLARYNSDGSLDSTFGSGGIVNTPWPTTGQGVINAIVLQGDGKILAVGKVSPTTPGASAWGLARYNSDGSLDTTFGTGGLVSVDTPVSYDFHNGSAQSVALQSNGEIVVLGSALDANFNHTFAVATFTPTGALDPAFGGTGYVLGTDNSATSSLSFLNGTTQNVLIQPADGKIVITGVKPDNSKQGASDFAVARYDGVTTL